MRRRRKLTPHAAVWATAGGASYTGPGDVVSGAVAWWGLRAYSAAKAGTAAVRLQRTDTVQADISTLANGQLNTSDAFFNGSAYFVVKLYDQTGNGVDLDVPISGAGTGPTFTLAGSGALPMYMFGVGNNQAMRSTNNATASAPFTYVCVGRNDGDTSDHVFIGADAGTFDSGLRTTNTGANIKIYQSGGGLSVTAAINTWHAIVGVGNGASSAINIDGTDTTGDSGGTGVPDLRIALFCGADAFAVLNASIVEGGLWNTGFNATQRGNMTSNMRSFWGF